MSQRWNEVTESDHEPLKTLIEELKSIGWPTVQWGGSGVVLSPSGNYRTAFFETFGEKSGFIRGEGATVLEAAQKALAKIKKQAACSHPDDAWKYTHNNGNKTCGLCGFFTACTVEEAMKNYDHGQVRTPDRSTWISFDSRRPLCPTCGGHVLVHDPVFEVDRCTCGQLLETVTEKDGMPAYDRDHNLIRRPIDSAPQVVGFWNPAAGKWLGEEGHIKTCRLDEVQRWRTLIHRYLKGGTRELRLVKADKTPGDIVPFSYDEEKEAREFAESMTNLVEALTGKREAAVSMPEGAVSTPKESEEATE